ncbi:MAG TPA: DNA polymerase I [Candidatus Cybelea sp.]|nr:DNA polymerase I [Candidatus Cybelea sp.]
MLLDTYGLVYRAFFALPGLTTSSGTPINAVYGFTMMLNKLIADERPAHVLAAFDKGMPADRLALFGEYKAQRRTMPDELRSQFALVRRVLDTYGIPIVEMDGQEADDVIATLSQQAQEAGEQTIVVTGDLDLLQIVDERTTVLVTRRGITELGRYDPAAVRERFGLDPAQLPDYRGLKGDPSDNLPGIPGVGEKTASKLLQAAGSLDALIGNPELAGNPKLTRLIEEYGQQACLCRAVSVVRRDLPLHVDWEASRYEAPGDRTLYPLFRELEFKTLLAKLSPPADLPLFEQVTKLTGDYRSFVHGNDSSDLMALAGELEAYAGEQRVAFALRDEALGLSARAGQGVSLSTNALASGPVREAVLRIFASPGRRGGYDVKRLLHTFERAGITGVEFSDDAMIGAHLLDPSHGFADVEDAAAAFLGFDLPSDAAAAADATLQLIAKVRSELQARGQLSLYEDLELPLAPVLAKMEAAGVAIDPAELRVIGDRVDASAQALRGRIFDLSGEEFNIGSPQQLGKVLFGKLNIPGGKKTKTGWATGVEVLQGLAREYPICALVLEWREVTKLKNTYVDVIPELVDDKDGRLRTEFNQTATATGRLSSTNPNLQNIPVRGELGRRIRRAFVSRSDEYVLLAADYSQIELRLMAHLSGDEAMLRAFDERQDIHDFTARQIFGITNGEVDPNQRRMAKSVNFGLLYGMSDFGLAQRLEIGRAEAKEITAAYFARFPSVRAHIDRTIEEARAAGYVATILGRRRYMPGLTSGNYMLRAAAEREATNAPLQGSAADLMKLAMVRIDRALHASRLDASMLLQIHDELIFEVRKTDAAATAELVRTHMESALDLRVPLEVTIKTGRNWYDVEPLTEESLESV